MTDVPIELRRSDYADQPYEPCVEVGVGVAEDWFESLPEDDWRSPALRAYGFVARTFMRAFEVLPHAGADPEEHGHLSRRDFARRHLGDADGERLWQHRHRLRLTVGLPRWSLDDGGDWWYGAESLPPKELRRLLPLLERLVVAVVADTAAEMGAAT